MAKAARKQEQQPSGYRLLVGRLQRLINSPPVQLARAATIRKQEDEAQEDWDRLLEELRSNDALEMEVGEEEGSITLRWQVDESTW